jgi:hypothetical protein
VYCISVLGVTGERAKQSEGLPELIARIRAHIKHPLAIGFGISSREAFETVGQLGEAVVVGSSLIRTLEAVKDGQFAKAIKEKIQDFTAGTRSGNAKKKIQPAEVSAALAARTTIFRICFILVLFPHFFSFPFFLVCVNCNRGKENGSATTFHFWSVWRTLCSRNSDCRSE